MTSTPKFDAALWPRPLPSDRQPFRYRWPHAGALDRQAWRATPGGRFLTRRLPEDPADLARDSRWPAFFPSPICIATTSVDGVAHVEKVVGATIVNRFPYVVALSFCRQPLSERHYVRQAFMTALEKSGTAAVQFLMPGDDLQRLMAAIADVPPDQPPLRFDRAGLHYHQSAATTAPVLAASYLVYQCRLVRPGRDFSGDPTYETAWIDVGSHRVYFLEIQNIRLREDIAQGRSAIHWRSLPTWPNGPPPVAPDPELRRLRADHLAASDFVKPYQADYVFPARGTIAFAADEFSDGFGIKHLPPLPQDQVEVDNDLARWPCFFPSSVGLITVEDGRGRAGAMPCGSTTILSRHPLSVAICVSYAHINARYGERASLELLRSAAHFGCGVPFYRGDVLEAIAYLGNVSRRLAPDKLAACGLTVVRHGSTIGFAELPVHFDCRIVLRRKLGTHMLFVGEVENVFVRAELTPENPLEWCPWAGNVAP